MTTATKTPKIKTDSPTWLENHTPAVRGVYTALSAHPGSTAADLADLAGVGRSTATKALTTLETAGHAKRTSTPRTATGRRTPDNWQTTITQASTAKRTPKTPTEARVSSAPTTATSPVAAPTAAATAAVRASKRSAAPTEATPPVPAPTRPPIALPEGKLRNGELTQLVMDQLNAAPAQEWTVRDLWKILDRSQGAISNALERATIKGTAVRTGDAPRRYRLTTAPAEPADGELVTAGAPGSRGGRRRRARS